MQRELSLPTLVDYHPSQSFTSGSPVSRCCLFGHPFEYNEEDHVNVVSVGFIGEEDSRKNDEYF